MVEAIPFIVGLTLLILLVLLFGRKGKAIRESMWSRLKPKNKNEKDKKKFVFRPGFLIGFLAMGALFYLLREHVYQKYTSDLMTFLIWPAFALVVLWAIWFAFSMFGFTKLTPYLDTGHFIMNMVILGGTLFFLLYGMAQVDDNPESVEHPGMAGSELRTTAGGSFNDWLYKKTRQVAKKQANLTTHSANLQNLLNSVKVPVWIAKEGNGGRLTDANGNWDSRQFVNDTLYYGKPTREYHYTGKDKPQVLPTNPKLVPTTYTFIKDGEARSVHEDQGGEYAEPGNRTIAYALNIEWIPTGSGYGK